MSISATSSIAANNTINTGGGNDNVHISKASGLAGALGYYDVNINGKHQLMTKSQLEHTTFNLGAGNDKLVVDSNVTADIHANGGAGNDLMVGGGGDDHLNGGSGNDAIYGRGGNDDLNGGSGNDWMSGGNGNDVLRGGSGNDWQFGGNGNDVLVGGSGRDVQVGGPGFDIKI
jgi:Ca2+-binding RTX toxin-like protein